MGDFESRFNRKGSGGRKFGGKRSSGRKFDRKGSGGKRFGSKGPGKFGKRDSGRNRSSERLEMHSVVCDKCGADCKVPFKPTQGKPIYCNDCFKDKSKEVGSRSGFGKKNSNEDVDRINKKLDRILKILGESDIQEDRPKKARKKRS